MLVDIFRVLLDFIFFFSSALWVILGWRLLQCLLLHVFGVIEGKKPKELTGVFPSTAEVFRKSSFFLLPYGVFLYLFVFFPDIFSCRWEDLLDWEHFLLVRTGNPGGACSEWFPPVLGWWRSCRTWVVEVIYPDPQAIEIRGNLNIILHYFL